MIDTKKIGKSVRRSISQNKRKLKGINKCLKYIHKEAIVLPMED